MPNNIPVTVASYDPGRIRDHFGMLGARIDESHIYLTNATVWIHTDSTDVTPAIAEINKEANFDVHLCESNNQGYFIIDNLKRYHHIYCRPITNVKELKDKEKIKQGTSMPKNITVEWVEYARRVGIIVMPARSTWTDGMILLDRQLKDYVSYVTRSGVSYGAATEKGHDDLVACLLLLCHWAKKHILKIGYHDVAAFGTHKSKVFQQIQNMHRGQKDIVQDETERKIKKMIHGRVPSNYKMKINGRYV